MMKAKKRVNISKEEGSLIGWCEWVGLPEWNIPAMKAKMDSGAKTCALHAFYVEPFEKEGEPWVKFGIHAYDDAPETVNECEAKVVDQRLVRDSGGHEEMRYVIMSICQLGDKVQEVQTTLTNRDAMQFPMLVGRNALKNGFLVDSGASYLLGKPKIDEQPRAC